MEAKELSNFDLRHEAQSNPTEEIIREVARRGIHVFAYIEETEAENKKG